MVGGSNGKVRAEVKMDDTNRPAIGGWEIPKRGFDFSSLRGRETCENKSSLECVGMRSTG